MVFHIDNAQKITLDPRHVMHDDVKKKKRIAKDHQSN